MPPDKKQSPGDWIRSFFAGRLRSLSLAVFGTVSVDESNPSQLLPSTTYSLSPFGMSDLQQETYKFPVNVIRSGSKNGKFEHGPFRISRFHNGYVSGNGRGFDGRSRLVLDSVASHQHKVNNPGLLRTRRALRKCGVYMNLNWWPGTGNIFHWNRDVLSRAYALNALTSETSIKLIASDAPFDYQTHGLQRLSQIFENVDVVHQKFGEWWRVDELVVPSQAPYLTGSGFLHPDVADFVRDVNLHGVPVNHQEVPILYVSREKSRHRRILDEEKLLREIQSNFPIKVAQLESYSYLEQMMLMQSVEVLVGAYGAGLSHVLFTKRRGLIEIHNGDSQETHFATLALAARCPYRQIQGGRSNGQQDFELGENGIAGVLRALAEMVN